MKQLVFIAVSLAIVTMACCHQTAAQYVWTKSLSPVLTPSSMGSGYSAVWGPSILYNTDSARYEMWFSISPGPSSSWRPMQIAFATSKDGLSWSIVGSGPVLTSIPGTMETNVANPSVLREGTMYKMWYSAWRGGNLDSAFVMYATSSDGINWTKYAGNPVLRAGPAAWEYNGVGDVSVLHTGNSYHMWYVAGPMDNNNIGRIGRATSTDGINWTKDAVNNPVLNMGGIGDWDEGAIVFPEVFTVGTTMYMCYSCWKSGGAWRAIGLASSTNGGSVWQKYGTGPILSAGASGSWDGSLVQGGFVLAIRDTLHMWYDGYASTTVRWNIGHATSPLPASGILDHAATIPREFMLEQNYPNPFNPSTTIKYELPKSSVVRLSAYDMLGREVSVLVDEREDAGVYEIKFDASGLSSGVYFYRLRAGDFIQARKLLLLR